MNSRGVLIMVAGVLLGACGTATPGPDQVNRAWKAALESPSCPKRHMVTANKTWLKFVVSGCGLMEQVQMTCDDQQCTRQVLSATRMDQPKRLMATGPAQWADPDHVSPEGQTIPPPPAGDPKATPKVVVAGGRLSDINAPAHKPTLPKEINRAGIVVWGMYKVCVSAEGNVHAVSVLKSALPGGMDAHWVSRIETFKYRPYSVDGRPVPFCHPARIEVRSLPG